jgi:hypothetical protein
MFSNKAIQDVYEPLSKEWNALLSINEKYSRKLDKIKHMTKYRKKYEKQGFNNDPLPSNYIGLCQKYDVEIADLEIQMADIDKHTTQLWDQMEGVYKITDKNSRLRKISRHKKRQLEKETCAICYESHSLKQLTTTSCGHTFGKTCLSKMMEYNYDNATDTMCPCCRNPAFELVRYFV